jgi:hypothetical protein
MKLHLWLLLGMVLAVLVWLALESGGRRGRVSLADTRAVESSPASADRAAPLEEAAELVPSLEPERAALPRAAERRAAEPTPVDPSELAPTSRGRLVDELTLEPISDALVVTSKNNDWTDDKGWFDTGDVLDGLADLMVVNVSRGTARHEIPRERWTRLARGWQIPLAIGPTYRLRVHGVEDAHWDEWLGRLAQEDHANERWLGLRSGLPPFLRFEEPPRGLAPDAPTWLELRSQDGRYEGRAEVTCMRGVQVVEVDCRARPAVRGFVRDQDGKPRGGILIEAVQISATAVERVGGMTGADGNYLLSAAEPGRMQLVFLPPDSRQRERLALDVPPGLTQAPDVVIAPQEPAGSIGGTLVSRGHPRLLDSVRLRARDGSGYELWVTPALDQGAYRATRSAEGSAAFAVPRTVAENEPWTVAFRFQNVPAGRYELTVVASDGQSWSPSVLMVEPPAEGLVFELEAVLPALAYFLEARDAETGAPLENVHVSIHDAEGLLHRDESLARREPLLELARPVAFEWSAVAPGYRAARGSERDFQGDGARRTATIALHRGFSARLRFLDWSRSASGGRWSHGPWTEWSAPGPTGVQVLADGALVATSDEIGLATLDLDAAPSRIEPRLPGWRVLESPDLAVGKLAARLEAVIWMVRE